MSAELFAWLPSSNGMRIDVDRARAVAVAAGVRGSVAWGAMWPQVNGVMVGFRHRASTDASRTSVPVWSAMTIGAVDVIQPVKSQRSIAIVHSAGADAARALSERLRAFHRDDGTLSWPDVIDDVAHAERGQQAVMVIDATDKAPVLAVWNYGTDLYAAHVNDATYVCTRPIDNGEPLERDTVHVWTLPRAGVMQETMS